MMSVYCVSTEHYMLTLVTVILFLMFVHHDVTVVDIKISSAVLYVHIKCSLLKDTMTEMFITACHRCV